MEKRMDDLTNWMKKEEVQFALITSTPNIFYLSNFYTTPHERIVAIGVFQTEEPFLICPNMEVGMAKQAGWHYELIGYSDIEDPWELIQAAILKRKIAVHTVAIEKKHLTFEQGEILQHLFPQIQLKNLENIFNQLRLIKDEKELSILKEAAKLADFGVEVGVHAIKEGVSELEIVAKIEYELKKKGVQEMSFSTMVLSGEKTALPHGTPSLEQIQKGDLILFDLGVILEGYCSDITRTVAFQQITNQQREIYETVLRAQLAAIKASQPNVEIGTIDKAARSIITEAGYGDYFTHRLGHGLGIDVHEFPSIHELNRDQLKVGMTYTIEPGIYVPHVAGVRIEDDVYITENGAEVLTNYPKELQII